MATTMTVSEARAALPQVLDRVRAGEEVTITRHGEPVAVVVRPDRLRARRADAALGEAERIGSALHAARGRKLRARGSLTAAEADALVADVRAGRSSRQ
ncbi:MAG: hypothetical protein QOI47_2549 [Actinomycetota bacterium]|jgi:prevent-host-death family protein|nr:hypothetical protein [Actinomycetota bacterium]